MKSVEEKINDLSLAISEAERFLERAKYLQLRFGNRCYYGKYHAAVKRASMDLTMALAEFRKS